MTVEQETEIIRQALKHILTDRDIQLSANALITKYSEELNDFCNIDKDTAESFGFVNTWWVFGEVVSESDYNIFMAEAENIGYKRSKRGEKLMQNDLYRTNTSNQILVDDGINTAILDYMRELQWD